METFWLEGRQDMSEANETMVCLWRPQKKNTQKTKQKSISTDTNANSNSNQTLLGIKIGSTPVIFIQSLADHR
jgi:hypothetical protein